MKKLIDEIINNGGASLDNNYKIMNIEKGYSVSILGQEKTYCIDNLNYNDIIEDLKQKQELIKDKKGYYVGLWVDDNKLYTDVSKTITNYKQAKEFGIANKQKAIFDNKNKKCVELVNYYYIVYNYNEFTNDITYIKEFDNYNTCKTYLLEKYNIKDFKNHITSTLDNIKNINNLVIFKEKAYLIDSI